MDLGDGSGAALGVLDVLYRATWPSVFLGLACVVVRRRAARGTWLRYVARSLHPVVILGTMVLFTSQGLADLLRGRWLMAGIDGAFVVAYAFVWQVRDVGDDDDDDFWKGLARRRRARRVRARLRRPGLSGTG